MDKVHRHVGEFGRGELRWELRALFYIGHLVGLLRIEACRRTTYVILERVDHLDLALYPWIKFGELDAGVISEELRAQEMSTNHNDKMMF